MNVTLCSARNNRHARGVGQLHNRPAPASFRGREEDTRNFYAPTSAVATLVLQGFAWVCICKRMSSAVGGSPSMKEVQVWKTQSLDASTRRESLI